jgi:hypothetical protein
MSAAIFDRQRATVFDRRTQQSARSLRGGSRHGPRDPILLSCETRGRSGQFVPALDGWACPDFSSVTGDSVRSVLEETPPKVDRLSESCGFESTPVVIAKRMSTKPMMIK